MRRSSATTIQLACTVLVSSITLSDGLAVQFTKQSGVQTRPFTVCIDPGHPSEVNSGKTIQNGTCENHIDWVVALRLQQLLKDRHYHVVMTKSSENQLVTNVDRALVGNRVHADLTVRLHCDASPDTGYALYYPDRQGTAHGKTGPTADVMKTSKLCAELLDAGMALKMNGILKNGGVRGDSRTLIGSKQGALTGSIFSQVPIVTIEMVVLSNKKDADYAKTESGQQSIADAIATGIEMAKKQFGNGQPVVNSASVRQNP